MHYQNEQGQSIIVGIVSSGLNEPVKEVPGVYKVGTLTNYFTRVSSRSKHLEAFKKRSPFEDLNSSS